MKLNDIRDIIREEVERALDEADKAASGAPKSFGAFRKKMATAMKKAGVPSHLVDVVADVGYEGDHPAAQEAWRAWDSLSAEMRGTKIDDDDYNSVVDFCVHDAVINMLEDTDGDGHYDDAELERMAQGAADNMKLGSGVKKPRDLSKSDKAKDLLALVCDVLEMSKAVKNIDDNRIDTVTYDVTRSDFLELIEQQALKAGLTQVSEDEYHDEETGLSVAIGVGSATIM